jgi:adenine-specific DNA-methyltransferase
MNKPSGRLERCREILGVPHSEGAGYAIYCMDCLEALKTLPPEITDLTVTSPPYNIGKEYEQPRPIAEYADWCQRWFAEVFRLTTRQGAFWLNLGYVALPDRARAMPLPYLLWDRCPFYLMQEVVWNYGAGVASRKALSPRNEKFLWYVKDPENYTFNLDDIRDPDVKYPNQKKRGKLRCNTVGKNPSDVWQIAKVTSGAARSSPERAPHPAQFPLDLVTRIVRGFSRAGDLVLDPFMGSGTTAEACLSNDREVIGFEVRRDYCDFIARRLRRAAESQRTLFGT